MPVFGKTLTAELAEKSCRERRENEDTFKRLAGPGELLLRPATVIRGGHAAGSVLEEGGVRLDEILLLFGHIFERMNRVGGADWDAGAAVNAAFGIHVHLSGGFEARLVGLGVNAIGGADLDTERIFDAGISNYVSHDESFSWNEHSLRKECKKRGTGEAVILVTGCCAWRKEKSLKVSRFQGQYRNRKNWKMTGRRADFCMM